MRKQPTSAQAKDDLTWLFLEGESSMGISSNFMGIHAQLVSGAPQTPSTNSYDSDHYSNHVLSNIERYNRLHALFCQLPVQHQRTLEAYFAERNYPNDIRNAFGDLIGIILTLPDAQHTVRCKRMRFDLLARTCLPDQQDHRYSTRHGLTRFNKTKIKKLHDQAEKLLNDALTAYQLLQESAPKAKRSSAFKL